MQSIVSKAKKNRAFLSELRAKEHLKERQKEAIITETRSVFEAGIMIESAAQIKERVLSRHELEVPTHKVVQVFR